MHDHFQTRRKIICLNKTKQWRQKKKNHRKYWVPVERRRKCCHNIRIEIWPKIYSFRHDFIQVSFAHTHTNILRMSIILHGFIVSVLISICAAMNTIRIARLLMIGSFLNMICGFVCVRLQNGSIKPDLRPPQYTQLCLLCVECMPIVWH